MTTPTVGGSLVPVLHASLCARLRSHALFLSALGLGALVRCVVIIAYRPALLFTDSFAYIHAAQTLKLSPNRPIGYSFFLRPFVLGFNDLAHALTAVQVVQHLIGLLLAVVVYAFLRRRGLPGWGATLAALPLLLDPLELVLEHYVLSDVLFSTLLVLAVVAVSWNHRPGWAAVASAGALVGAATLVRGAGTFVAVAFVVALLSLRVPWRRTVGFLVAFAIPIGAYAAAFDKQHGEFATSTAGQFFLYSRIAPIVDCHDPQLALTPRMHRLCPEVPRAQRRSANYYMWNPGSPLNTVKPPPGLTRQQFIGRFNKHVIRSQPLRIASVAMEDFFRGFAPVRTYQASGYKASNWLFADDYWIRTSLVNSGVDDPIVNEVSARPGAAGFMARYRQYVYLPGPLAGALFVIALIAACGFGRARRSGDRVVIGLAAGTCLLTLLTGAALSGFSWRYQLPQIAMAPMAGALGLAALWRGPGPAAPDPAPPLRPLDKGAALLSKLPLGSRVPAGVSGRPATGGTRLVVALVIGLATAVVVSLGGVASGYLRPSFAGLVGASAGVLVIVCLLVGRARLARDEASDQEEPTWR